MPPLQGEPRRGSTETATGPCPSFLKERRGELFTRERPFARCRLQVFCKATRFGECDARGQRSSRHERPKHRPSAGRKSWTLLVYPILFFSAEWSRWARTQWLWWFEGYNFVHDEAVTMRRGVAARVQLVVYEGARGKIYSKRLGLIGREGIRGASWNGHHY